VPNPPGHPLDTEVYVRGIHRTANSNWRLAVENGFDPGHILIHYDNILLAATERKLYLGAEPLTPEAVKMIDEPDGGSRSWQMRSVSVSGRRASHGVSLRLIWLKPPESTYVLFGELKMEKIRLRPNRFWASARSWD